MKGLDLVFRYLHKGTHTLKKNHQLGTCCCSAKGKKNLGLDDSLLVVVVGDEDEGSLKSLSYPCLR